jgi:hypothetical protein
LWAKGLNAKDVDKEMFPVYGGKCVSRKAVHNCVKKRGKSFADDEEVETGSAEVAETTVKNFYAAGFDIDGSSVSVLVEDMSRNKCFSQVRISNVLRFISIFDLRVFTGSPS